MKREFKAGDLVFALDIELVCLELDRLVLDEDGLLKLKNNIFTYLNNGTQNQRQDLPLLFHANPENRQALVTLYGEENVPELPLMGSEMTKKLLEKQKYVICWVSDLSEGYARQEKFAVIIHNIKNNAFEEADRGYIVSGIDKCWKYAIPIDNNGNEIKGLDDE